MVKGPEFDDCFFSAQQIIGMKFPDITNNRIFKDKNDNDLSSEP